MPLEKVWVWNLQIALSMRREFPAPRSHVFVRPSFKNPITCCPSKRKNSCSFLPARTKYANRPADAA